MKTRREFIAGCAAGAGLLALNKLSAGALPAWMAAKDDPWSQLQPILDRIKAPGFPSRDFDVQRYGARGDNSLDCTDAFRKTIDVCAAAGGGVVVVPKGEFLTGAIHLRSNVNLHISEGATIRFTRDTKKYPLVFTRWEGVELMNYSPFIYAWEQENIGLTGAGTIDGNSDCEHWWPWKGRTNCGWKKGEPEQTADRNQLFAMADKGVPVRERVFGEGHYLRPQFIQPYRSKNVLIEGVTLQGSPMWQVHPVLCGNVTVRNLKINADGPNTDGCDPESCTDVLIDGCFFNTGDDCIAVKSGRNADGRRVNVPAQNLVIRNCHMKNGHGGVTVGSEISGGVRNVFAEKCQMDSPELDIAVRLKDNAARGGLLENIHARDLTIGQVKTAALAIDFYYEEGQKGGYKPVVRDVSLERVSTKKAQYAVYLRGFENAPIVGVTLKNCDFEGVEKANVLENVKDLSVQNVRINGKEVERLA